MHVLHRTHTGRGSNIRGQIRGQCGNILFRNSPGAKHLKDLTAPGGILPPFTGKQV